MPKTSTSKAPSNPRQGSSRTTPKAPAPVKNDTSSQTQVGKKKPTTDKTSLSSELKKSGKNGGSNIGGLIGGLEGWGKKSGSAGELSVKEDQALPSDGKKVLETEDQAKAPQAGPRGEAARTLELSEGELLGRFQDSSPEQVTNLQEMLQENGIDLAIDGKFGPETARAVEEYQTQNNLKVDGIVGPETMGALNGGATADESSATSETDSPAAPGTPRQPGEPGQLSLHDPDMTPQEQYDHYREIIEANGGSINADGPTVLGLRGLGVDGERHSGTSNVGGYDDSFVVLQNGPDGNPRVDLISGATHANQRTSSASFGPDQNGNTVRGVAMLAPGTYDVNFATNNYSGNRGKAWHVVNENGGTYVDAYRDLDANGNISAAERQQAIDGGYQASAIMFHQGGANAPSSIGCQTFSREQHQRFIDAIGRSGFQFTLVDANNAMMPG